MEKGAAPCCFQWAVVMTDRVPLTIAEFAGALAERAATAGSCERLGALARGDGEGALHLAVLRKPFLGLMLSGRRTLESLLA
jgi:hypothetical protein